jgi:hypothetical protein
MRGVDVFVLVGSAVSILLLIAGPTLFFLPRTRWCFRRHSIVHREWVSDLSEKLTCSCGRLYGINHHVGIALPWDRVKEFYESEKPSSGAN